MKRKGWSNILLLALLSIGIPVFLAAGLYVFLFHINQFHLELTVRGEKEVTLEYGETYTDAGADAAIYGSLVMQAGREVPVSVQNGVNDRVVGTYEVRYHAVYEKWSTHERRVVHIVDTQKPQILLRSSRGAYTIPGQPYEEEGFLAADNYDGNITGKVVRTEQNGTVTYTVADSSGNSTEVTRQIVYYDPIPPELILAGDSKITITQGKKYQEPGYTATDNCDGDLTESVRIDGKVNTAKAGTYTLTYSVTDSYGNSATATRTVVVKAKPKVQSSSQNTVVPNGKVIYLTFDDGPSKYTAELLDVLAKYDVKATFFVINSGYGGTLQRIVNEGHSIGIHSATHEYKTIYASEEAFFADLEKMQGIIESKTGVKTYLMRFPGGSSNTVSSFNEGIMTRLTAAVEERGYRYFDWNVTSGDAGETKSTEQVYKNVIAGVQKRDVSIVLQHDSKSYSVDAVEKIIKWGLENGYTFLPLDMTSPTAHHRINN